MKSSAVLIDAVIAALFQLPSVHAHGYVSSIVVGGQSYLGSNPNWYYQSADQVQVTAGWYAYNQDSGFVSPDAYQSNNITCHKLATPGRTSVPMIAGSQITLQWNTWPDTHHGPVLDYLAKCAGDCTQARAEDLTFFKIDHDGLHDDSNPPGTWADDQLIAQGNSWTITIPTAIASGNYVLRHEIIALHSAQQPNGAQNYPQCINLQISSSGTANPCSSGGADCQKGTALYNANDPGISLNIYQSMSSYKIPGPSVWSGGSGNSGPSTGTSTTLSTSSSQTSATTPPPSGSTQTLYGQCGGSGYTGPTACPPGNTCMSQNPYYSQCLTTAPAGNSPGSTTTTTVPAGATQTLWGQCGGEGWTGPTACPGGECEYQNEYYSQCVQ